MYYVIKWIACYIALWYFMSQINSSRQSYSTLQTAVYTSRHLETGTLMPFYNTNEMSDLTNATRSILLHRTTLLSSSPSSRSTLNLDLRGAAESITSLKDKGWRPAWIIDRAQREGYKRHRGRQIGPPGEQNGWTEDQRGYAGRTLS